MGKAARALIRRYGADLAPEDIQGDLQALYDYISSGRDGRDELTYTEARRRAEAIAGKLVENAVTRDSETYDQYRDLRDYLRKTEIVLGAEDQGDIPDLNDFRKRQFGRMNLKTRGRTNIDQVYQEMAFRWPEFFDENRESHPADQLLHIAEVLEGVYTVTEYNPFSQNLEQAAAGAANEILEGFFDLPQAKATFADKQARKLEQLREENRETVRRAVQRERADREKQLTRLKDRYQEQNEAGRERRSRAELRRRITLHAERLSRKLLRPTDKANIPESLRTPVAALLASIRRESAFEYAYGRDARYHQVEPGTDLGSEATRRTQAGDADSYVPAE